LADHNKIPGKKGSIMEANQQFILDIAKTIAESTGLKNVDYSQVTLKTKLNEPPFNLDSIDILEAVNCIEEKYKVRVMDAKEGATHFQTMETIMNFINAKK
jgi:acyl carrier protein